jgi:TPR repeat protein
VQCIVTAKEFLKTLKRRRGGFGKQQTKMAPTHCTSLVSRVAWRRCFSRPRGGGALARWYRKAANQGIDSAQHDLGVLYFNGKGVSQDYTEAAYWFRKGADQGNAGTQCSLAVLHLNSQGVAQDDNEAASWIRIAADQGNANAQSNLGGMYRNGHGVVQDDNEAKRWLQKAADQGHADAQRNLALYELRRREAG